MKTPMQELLERVKEYRDSETSPLVTSRLNSVYVDILGMLEKEEEVINRAYSDGVDNARALYECKDYYNETFKTKEI